MCQGNNNTQMFLLLGDSLFKTWGKRENKDKHSSQKDKLGLGKILESDFSPDMFTCMLCYLVQSAGTLWSSPATSTWHSMELCRAGEAMPAKKRSSPAGWQVPLIGWHLSPMGALHWNQLCCFLSSVPGSPEGARRTLHLQRNCPELTNISLPSLSF